MVIDALIFMKARLLSVAASKLAAMYNYGTIDFDIGYNQYHEAVNQMPFMEVLFYYRNPSEIDVEND